MRRYVQFSRAEMERRWERFRAILAGAGADAGVVWGTGAFNADIYYLTDWPGGREGYLFFPVDGEPVVLVQLYNHVPMAQRVSQIPDVRWGGRDSAETLSAILRERLRRKSRVALVGALPYHHFERLREDHPHLAWIDLTAAYRHLRSVRSPEELERVRVACEITDRSMESLEAHLRPGLREADIAALIEPIYLQAGGYAGIHYFASVPMRDPDIFVPAQYPSTRLLEKGDAVITEITGAYWGYSGQIHRTYFIGEPPVPSWEQLHEAAVEAFLAIERVLKHGASVKDVLDAAELIYQRGYDIYDDLLHGLSQLPPIVRTRRSFNQAPEDFLLEEDMVMVIQPNLITPDRRMGLQFGETVRITRSGVERLNQYRRDPVVCAGS